MMLATPHVPRRLACLVIGLVLTCWPAWSKAELVLPYIFSDGAVLQRDTPVAIWGTATAGARVSVRFRDATAEASANAEGRWRLTLPPMPVADQPADLTVKSTAAQDAPRTIRNLLVGDVWLCSGQSNMYWPLGKVGIYPGVDDSEATIAAPADPQLRLFCDDMHPLWEKRGWQSATPESRRPFSAVAYFYGERLRRELGVPIGLINISRGGTPIQRWTPPDFAERVPLTRRYNALFNQERKRIDEYNRQHAERERALRERRESPATAPAALPADLMIARSFSGATAYERFVAPIVPYTLRGVVWYQGESNSGELEVAKSYAPMLKALVEGWRDAWAAPELPFYFVQLPCRDGGEFWPWTRQGMLLASQSLPHCEMVVSLDVGDPANLHPPQKRPIGERLAAAALARSYGRPIPWSGPSITNVTSSANKVTLRFDPAKGLPRAKDTWRDVELAGADGAFHPASVTLSGDTATAESEQVAAPTSIRYGWRPVFTPTLLNDAGLPGSGFSYVRDANGRWSLYVP